MHWQGIVFLVFCMTVYADYLIKPGMEIPEYVEELEKTFPQGSDWMKLIKPESKSCIFKNGIANIQLGCSSIPCTMV